jgi:hypothetical protein
MGNNIKYLNYTVSKDGNKLASGSVPALLAVGGTNKNYDLAGVWLTYKSEVMTKIDLSDNDAIDMSLCSDCTTDDWLAYKEGK